MGNFNQRYWPERVDGRDTVIRKAIARAKHLERDIDVTFCEGGTEVDFTVTPDSKMKDVINDFFHLPNCLTHYSYHFGGD